MTSGSILAEVALEYCHEVGNGVPQKLSEAARVYGSGASRGSPETSWALWRILDRMRPLLDEFRMKD